MDKFCPQCGAPVSEGTFCDACSDDTPSFDPVSVDICPTRQYKLDAAWQPYESPDEVIDAVAASLGDVRVVSVSHNIDRLRHNTGATVDVSLVVEADGSTTEVPLMVRVRQSPARKKQQQSHKVATVQVRDVTERVRSHLHSVLGSVSPRSSLQAIDDVEHGIDLRYGDAGEAESMARRLCQELGGVWEGSRSLHTVDSESSKRVYRSTYVVRPVPFSDGDVIVADGHPYHVVGTGAPVRLCDLRTGEQTTRPAEELLDATVKEKHKVTVSATRPALRVLHPESYQAVDALNPYDYGLVPGQTVTVVVADRVIICND